MIIVYLSYLFHVNCILNKEVKNASRKNKKSIKASLHSIGDHEMTEYSESEFKKMKRMFTASLSTNVKKRIKKKMKNLRKKKLSEDDKAANTGLLHKDSLSLMVQKGNKSSESEYSTTESVTATQSQTESETESNTDSS